MECKIQYVKMKIDEYKNTNNYLKKTGWIWVDRLLSHDRVRQEIKIVSVLTPSEKLIPYKLGMIFNWNDLSTTDILDLEIISGKHLGRPIKILPLGHHCELTIKYSKWSELFNLLQLNKYDTIKLGFCNIEDWTLIKNILTESRT